MKKPDPTAKDEALSKLLRTLKPDAPLPPRFPEAVWKRIETADPGLKLSFWRGLLGRVEAVFARPALAAAYVAVLLFVGVGAGYWHAGDRSAQVRSDLRLRYVHSVDPYQMPRP
jgi:hypothetical protein